MKTVTERITRNTGQDAGVYFKPVLASDLKLIRELYLHRQLQGASLEHLPHQHLTTAFGWPLYTLWYNGCMVGYSYAAVLPIGEISFGTVIGPGSLGYPAEDDFIKLTKEHFLKDYSDIVDKKMIDAATGKLISWLNSCA